MTISNKTMVVPDKSNPDSKKVQVENMFDSIAPKYDVLNHTLSLNIDKIWRRKVARIVSKNNPGTVLDVATGTCDLAIVTARKAHPQSVCGIDLSEEMLKIAGLPFEVMLPLIDETACKVHNMSPLNAQTGPAIRYDKNVIGRHEQMLDGTTRDIYHIMSKSIHDKLRP